MKNLAAFFNNFFNNFDLKISIIGLISGIAMFLFSSMIMKSILLPILSFVILCSCGVYIFCRTTNVSEISFGIDVSPIFEKLILFFGNLFLLFYFIIGILFLHGSYGSSAIMVILIGSIACSFLGLEILILKQPLKSRILLLKILFLAIFVRVFAYYMSSMQAGIDTVYHAYFIEQTIINGFFPNGVSYSYFPIMSIVTSIISIISSLGIKDSLFFISVIAVIGLLFVFFIGKIVFNERIGLLSVLLISITTQEITLGWWITAMTLGILFVPLLIYLIYTKKGHSSFFFPIIIFPLMIVSVLTHPVPSTIIAMYFISIFGIFLIIRTMRAEIKYCETYENLLLFYCLFLVFYWVFIFGGFSIHVINSLQNIFSIDRSIIFDVSPVASIVQSTQSTKSNFWTQIWENSGLLLYNFFVIIGILTILKQIKTPSSIPKIVFAISSLILLFFIVGLHVFQISEALPGRWIIFYEIVSIFFVSVGIFMIFYKLKRKTTITVILFFLIILAFSCINITNGYSNILSIISLNEKPRLFLSDSEQESVNMMIKHSDAQNGKTVFVDTYFKMPYSYKSNINTNLLVYNSGDIIQKFSDLDGIILLRQEICRNKILLQESSGGMSEYKMPNENYINIIENSRSNIIYDSSTVKGLYNI